MNRKHKQEEVMFFPLTWEVCDYNERQDGYEKAHDKTFSYLAKLGDGLDWRNNNNNNNSVKLGAY